MLSLIGHYDSPYTRRVAIALTYFGMPFERQALSVFGDAKAVAAYNPLGRVPTLVLDDGQRLIDSSAILDYLDELVGPGRALLPANGEARRDALQMMALATGAADKAVAVTYEHRRSPDKIDAAWIARCEGQLTRALAEIDKRLAIAPADPLLQPGMTVATMMGYVRLRGLPTGMTNHHHPQIGRLCTAAEATAPFKACRPPLDEIGGTVEEARAALARLVSG